ncbi:MAG: C40 family peptidase [Firmicutes bacterium]|nr:C40 family peptidase [Bacillota bacterium]
MKKRIYRAAAFLCAAVMLSGAQTAVTQTTVYGETANITTASGVTDEMCSSEYWKSKLGSDADRVLMSADEIDELNKKMIAEPNTNMYDLENMPAVYEASIAERAVPEGSFYVNGKKINNEKYFGKMIKAMSETGYTGEVKTQYAVVTKRADMKDWPTNDIVGYSADDTDDELQNSSMNVNEPFVIKQKCVIDGQTFYNGCTFNCAGWVSADCLAICESKREWLSAWKVDTAAKNFIVVTQDKITLEPSMFDADISEVKLMIGTVLKLVPKEDIPQKVAERGTWNNYVVYLPTRDKNGKYVRKCALISQHYNVSTGFLPLTQANVLDTAFSCLGNRYGWGGMLDSMDCSAYTRHIYRCCGLELPRNTSWQTKIPDRVTDISAMSDEEKLEFFKTIPAGSLLMFKGHITVYIGSENGKAYVISDTGSLSDSEGELNVVGQMSVIVNPLDVRRGNGTTWLKNMIYAVSFGEGGGESPVYGDADADGVISAADSADILQKTLLGTRFIMPAEKFYDDWLKYIDVDMDENITASDAADVMQKVLDGGYKFPVE